MQSCLEIKKHTIDEIAQFKKKTSFKSRNPGLAMISSSLDKFSKTQYTSKNSIVNFKLHMDPAKPSTKEANDENLKIKKTLEKIIEMSIK